MPSFFKNYSIARNHLDAGKSYRVLRATGICASARRNYRAALRAFEKDIILLCVHSTHTPRCSTPTLPFFVSEFWVCFKHSTHTPRCSTPTSPFFVCEFWVFLSNSHETIQCGKKDRCYLLLWSER